MRKQIAPAVRTSGSTRRGRRFATVLTAVVAGAVLAACSSSSGDGSSTAPGTASTANASLTADLAAATAKKDVKVDLPALTKLPAVKGRTVLVVAISAVPFAGVISDLKAALQVVGASAHVCDGQAQAATISSCLAQAGTLNAVAVITLAIPYELAPTAFNAVAQQKIPVLAAFQDPLKKKSSATLTYQPSSPTLTAAFNASADYAIVHSNFKGNILVLIINDSPAQLAQGRSGVAYIKKNCPKCTVKSETVGTATIDQTASTVSAAVLRDPDINWILPQNLDTFGSAVYSSLQSSNATSKVSVGGPGAGIGGMQLLAQKHANYYTTVSNDLAAWNAVDGMLRQLSGQAVPANYPTALRLFDSSSVGSITVTADAANGFDWFGTPTYKDAYKKLWGVS